MKKINLILLLGIIQLSACAQKDNYLIVGTYTGGKSEGIYVYHFNSASGDFDSVSMVKTTNPSFLTVSSDERFVYAVNEGSKGGNGGTVSSFSFSKVDGRLTFINQEPSKGDDPCYISIDNSGHWAAIANYTSGTLSILPINKDGSLDPAKTVIQHQGKGTDPERQEGPHVHCVIFSDDDKYLFANDLGLDKIMIYNFNQDDGSLSPAKPNSVSTDPGTGPRHLAFDPDRKHAYLIQELKGLVSVYQYSDGKFKLIQNISSMPDNYQGPIGSADIHVSSDDNYVYASNRDSSNTIAIYKVDKPTGKLKLLGHQSTLGHNPRNFNFDPSGDFLLVGDQTDDKIVIFRVNKETGMLTDTGKRINVGKPVCLKWISK